MNSDQHLHPISPSFLEATVLKEKQLGLVAGFTTRHGGFSEAPYHSMNMGLHVGDADETVIRNRRKLADETGFPLSSWVVAEQVHGSVIKKVSAVDVGSGTTQLDTAIAGTDGIYTRDKDILLTSLYADCVPLFFVAPSHQTIGLAHAGWKGTVGLIGPKMIQTWQNQEQISSNDIFVLIGPSISGDEYEVNDVVIESVNSCITDSMEKPYTSKANGRFNLDLKQLNKSLLIEAGVPKENIYTSSICTLLDKRMFSHRGDGGKTGRMMSILGQRSFEV
ncbi:peptidoglycan editing factor PgeF [Alkalicoccobacillus porphyridii]|uniref:Purine nucleoside phosphorylase n=1 Tax=Alkalicoccobacillus porphyridii TaxID=2597270 RepID=A0A553ZY45_9BACI|nr:peptidoglycan editing factor PgeF [Alkalicoccobacillus porphyridii]TSB46335.1 peptidoglycan editing factor PgeF [Alkalicoccobacillus porphyridii]